MKIPNFSTEALQVFTAGEAYYWRLVPFRIDNGYLECVGDANNDYSDTLSEIKTIYGYTTRITTVSGDDLDRIIATHYRINSPAGITYVNENTDFVGRLIEEACSMSASDIHLEPAEEKCRVRFRVDGKLIEVHIIPKQDYPGLVNRLKILANLDISEKRLPQDGRILYSAGKIKFDIRLSVMPTIYGEKIVFRLLSGTTEKLALDELGLDDKQYKDYIEAIARPHGLILISGPTGSGKSTTLYATLDRLNKGDNNILTIEDPVEYTLDGINQVQLKEEIGLTFSAALRTFLRQDPDIIMLGEIRDEDTAEMAIRSSLTGHLLLSTLHTNSAWGCIDRLADMGIHRYLISETLIVCVAQRLIRLLCPYCKKKESRIHETDGFPEMDGQYDTYIKAGCPNCHFTGYKGRKAIYEVIPIDSFLSSAIRDRRQDIKTYLKQKQIKTLHDSAISLYLNGETSFEEILPILNDQSVL